MISKNKLLLITTTLLVVVTIIGTSYAIFNANVTVNNQSETVIVSNSIILEFDGVKEIKCTDIIPGDQCSKKFKLTNKSNDSIKYNIYMENILNGFNEDLVYELLDDNGIIISEVQLPSTSTGKSYLLNNITIPAKSTINYTLNVIYKYTEEDQGINLGKAFSSTVGVDTNKIENKYIP